MSKSFQRVKTPYPGVYYIMGKASDGRPENIFFIIYRKNGKLIEEKAGRQFKNDMTPAKAASLRTKRIEGAASNQERREAARKKTWTFDRLWQEYGAAKSPTQSFLTDRSCTEQHCSRDCQVLQLSWYSFLLSPGDSVGLSVCITGD